MINSITIPSDGGFYTFPNSSVFLTDHDGFMNPNPKLAQHEYSGMHGGLFLSQFYRTRRLVLEGTILGVDKASFAQARQDFSQAFSFQNAEKVLELTTEDGRELQCSVIISSAIRDKQQSPIASIWSLELDAVDPLFYSQSLSVVQGAVVTLTGSGFSLPFSLPLALSGSVNGVLNVPNAGNARVYPTEIRLDGPGTNFTISNVTTMQDLIFSGTLDTGDYVIIDPIRHTAVKNGLTNVYGLMSGDWWDLYLGNNTVTLLVGSGNTGATEVTIRWRSGYLAI